MAAYYLLSVGEKEFKLKMTTASKIDAEKKLGFSLFDAPDHLLEAETFAVLLWASLQKYHRNYPLTKVYDLVDEMEERGIALGEKAEITLEVLKVSGFFSQDQLQEMEAEKEKETAVE